MRVIIIGKKIKIKEKWIIIFISVINFILGIIWAHVVFSINLFMLSIITIIIFSWLYLNLKKIDKKIKESNFNEHLIKEVNKIINTDLEYRQPWEQDPDFWKELGGKNE